MIITACDATGNEAASFPCAASPLLMMILLYPANIRRVFSCPPNVKQFPQNSASDAENR